jgi:hypothetical protein
LKLPAASPPLAGKRREIFICKKKLLYSLAYSEASLGECAR